MLSSGLDSLEIEELAKAQRNDYQLAIGCLENKTHTNSISIL